MYNDPHPIPPPPPQKKKWYQKSGGIILLLFLFFPAGLYLMWRYATWNKAAKWIVTGIFVILVLANAVSSQSHPNNVTPATITQQQTTQTRTTPTPTPKPPTAKERIIAVAKENGGTDNNYIESLKVLQTTIILGMQWDNAWMKKSVEIECFDMQKALWTAVPQLELKTVIVTVKGDVVDKYGKESKEQVGYCTLKSETAAKFNWGNLTWRTAWDAYDNKGLAPFLQTD